MSRSLVSGSGLLAFMLATACTHAVRLRQPTEISASTSQIPIAVNLLIDARLRTYEAHPATYAGAVHHSFDVPIGPALADSLERAVRSVFRDAQVVTTTNGDRPTLSLALNGDPVMNTQWEMGLFLVGLRTDCILTVDARLLSEKGRASSSIGASIL